MRYIENMSKILFRYEDLKALPENGKRYEILERDLHVSPAPKTIHQTVVVNLTSILRDFVKKHSLGFVFCAPTDVVFSPENVVQPDVLFISHANKHILTETHIQGAPDLVVEVLSESTKDVDQTIKKKIYARFGVKFYWIIDPEQKALESFLLTEEGFNKERSYEKNDVITCALFPALSFSVNELFE